MAWAACCVAFFGFFFGCGEFTCSLHTEQVAYVISIDDISIDSHQNPQFLFIHLRKSKTDRYGRGVLISLGRTNSEICPVSAMLSFIAMRPFIPGPLFVSLDGCPLSRDTFVHIVREALLTGGLDVFHATVDTASE